MRTATSILTAKGYDSLEITGIISETANCLDIQVRSEFGVKEPIHLWESYYKGDANEKALAKIAKKGGYDGIDDLLLAMDFRLNELCEDYPEKIHKRILNALEGVSIEELMSKKFGDKWDEMLCDDNGEADTEKYAVMFNCTTEEIFVLEYATSSNGWAKTASQQNDYVIVGYISANDCTGDADDCLESQVKLKYNLY